ncbi:MAG: DUF3592 domain-containing protein [Ruminococcus sp.]|nr:DUF3592 domain-containing protein [Ruminococcus sp.]
MDYNFNNDNRDDFTLNREAMVDKFREKSKVSDRAVESLKVNKAFLKLRLMSSALFILAGLVFFIMGCIQTGSLIKAKHDCTVLVEGKVDSFNSTRSDEDSSPSYAPVFSYEYNGVKHIYAGNTYSGKGKLYVGQAVDIYVDPDKTDHVYVPAYKAKKSAPIAFIIIGLLLSAGPVLYSLNEYRSVERYWENEKNKWL